MHDFPLISTIAAAFTAAWVLGLITQRLGLSPIVGYLLAGIAIGPHTPGFTGDVALAQQLAELGVILLMFGVGLHFHLKDLLAVRKVAIPGAIGQSIVATVLAIGVATAFGWPLKSGFVLGTAMAVASTVVLMRVLMDNKMLDTPAGHVAVGWLIVEDILTVVLLVLLPAMGVGPIVEHLQSGGTALHAAATMPAAPDGMMATAAAPSITAVGDAITHATTAPSGSHAAVTAQHGLLLTLAIAMIKLAALVALMLLAGSKVIPWIMVRVARLRSRELFTLTVLVMAIAIAAGASYGFGASMALGAFLAGMVVGQSPVSHQAAADALPLRDAFAVLFFASVGMLFDPRFIIQEPLLFSAGLAIVLIGKPLAALVIVAVLGYPLRTGLTVAIGLAQIGEFSFIISDVGQKQGLLDNTGHNLLVATAIVSITLNPLLFRIVPKLEAAMMKSPLLNKLLNRRSESRQGELNPQAETLIYKEEAALAVVLGYGPVGRAVDQILREGGLKTVVVDLNMDTVEELTRANRAAIYGDAYNLEVMYQALTGATHLIITLPHSTNRGPLIAGAKLINPDIKVIVRGRYLGEREELHQVGADAACFEEAEIAVAMSKLVLSDMGANAEKIQGETQRIRKEFRLDGLTF